MNTFALAGHPFIALNHLLKIEGWVDSGAVAKLVIANGDVLVDGEIELRKRCKIIAGQKVSFMGQEIVVVD